MDLKLSSDPSTKKNNASQGWFNHSPKVLSSLLSGQLVNHKQNPGKIRIDYVQTTEILPQITLVGGFNPLEKYARQNGNLPHGSG